jgi:erythronate-4-phosphate dehydrogenase
VEESDIITLHVPLNRTGPDRTLHLVDEAFLARLKPHQVLVNTSRGEVVHSGALKAVLERRGLAACVLDVWEQEPLIDRSLLELVTIATPHIAGYSTEGKANGTAMSVQALSRHFGLPLTQWFPPDLPAPRGGPTAIDGTGLSEEEVLSRAVHHSYDITADDRVLRNDPGTFELQRSHYPVRREFPATAVALRGAGERACRALQQLGFRITTTHFDT